LKQRKIAAIFPAFGCKYLGKEKDILNEFSGLLPDVLNRAANTVDLDMKQFLTCADGNFRDDLQSQYAAYIYGCAVSNVLKRSGIHTAYAAGYSMGLYAALYHAESITFEQGLELIRTAYRDIINHVQKINFGIGLIAGLEIQDVAEILDSYNDLEIINVNNRLSFLIAGYEANVKKALKAAHDQGALNSKYLSFTSPYHSRFMDGAAHEFKKYLASADIRDPACPLVSTIDQRAITTSGGVVRDLTDNICRNINWLNTMARMIDSGVEMFIECGPGKSLYKMAQFMDGNFKVYPVTTIKDLIVSEMIFTQVQTATGVT
jgi:[acyl-carrier-protein] S-malonyltransferase